MNEIAPASRGRSPGGHSSNLHRNRSTSANRGGRALSTNPDISRYESQISDLRRNLSSMEDENDKLRSTMREMVDDYTKQLELRDETIKRLEDMKQSQVGQEQYTIQQLRQEMEDYRSENRALKDKVYNLTRQVEGQSSNLQVQQLKDEIERLNRSLLEKDRYIERQIADQKNEWAEIYGSHKTTIDQQTREIKLLQEEKTKLSKQLKDA
mmetsp:Transcript_15394/g.26017  ORF Transcript_15394/g.26017 Transcript_15394/m.26017 type:complete len:210 (-) Transcript_15394:296-925(-)